MARQLNNRSFEFLGVDQKVWISLETGGYGDDATGNLVPDESGAIDFNTCNIKFDIPRDDSPSRSGRSVVARLSGKKDVSVNIESHIIPGNPDALGNPTFPPMHPLLATAFGQFDVTNPAEIVYRLSRFNSHSVRILEEATHSARLTNGVVVDALTFNLPGADKAMMTMDGFAQDAYIGGETRLLQAVTGVEQLAALVVGDITYTAKTGSGINGNLISIAYVDGGTAGSEVVTVTGNAISVSMDADASTATQIKAAIDGTAAATALVDNAITGTGSNAQAAAAAANLVGGLGTNDIKLTAGGGELFDIGSYIDIIDGTDGDTAKNTARLVTHVAGKTVRERDLGVNSDIITLSGVALTASTVNDFVIGHAPANYEPLTSENALLGLRGSLTIAGVNTDDCEMINAEISITNNFTKKDFLYGTDKICGYIPDKRRDVMLNLELLLNRDTFAFYMRNKCFVAEEVTITLEPQAICAPAFESSRGRTWEFYFPKVEFNIPDIENPADGYVSLNLEGKALIPSANERDTEFRLTIK
ncbi:MAG: hypothetical protein K0U41_01020 [Gammaproteobacteria bacterium]|nr:hypothetical protein [Gammaproteobacteria bacterium]